MRFLHDDGLLQARRHLSIPPPGAGGERERLQDKVRDLNFRLVAVPELTDSDDDTAHMVWYCTYASFFCNAGHFEGSVHLFGVAALKVTDTTYGWR